MNKEMNIQKNIGDGRLVLAVPKAETRVLLHTCCAPCSGEVMQAMLASGIDLTLYFYNPNIHPREEYEIRKADNIRFAGKMNIPFIDADYDTDNWFARVKGMEWEPEKGKRCSECFDMRFERTALYGYENGFNVFTSCLGISRWKNMAQINESGHKAAARYPDMAYWDYNWRKGGGADRMVDIAKREEFYQQEYCGCIYSLRDTNKRRRDHGETNIQIGVNKYTFKE
jgi:predicted adenine nucleotide alpha hydrolase (AANH) superfamily ATPase